MLERLQMELEAIKLDDPEVVELVEGFELGDPEDGDEVVGVLDEQSIKLKILCTKMYKQAMQMAKDHEAAHLDPRQSHDKESCKALHEQFVAHLTRMELLQDLTWMIIRLDHNLTTAESVGVRKGWQVVKSSKPKPRTMDAAVVGMITMRGLDDIAEVLSMLSDGKRRDHDGCPGCSH